MKLSRNIPCACPYCHASLATVGNLDSGVTPYPGSFSVCFSCVGLLVFCDDLTVRKPTTEERRIAEQSPAVFDTQMKVRHFIYNKLGKSISMGGHA